MRDTDKKKVILEFLERMADKDIHLVDIVSFDKSTSIWSKKSPQSGHRTMINVGIKLDRLNQSDIDVEVDKYLMMSK